MGKETAKSHLCGPVYSLRIYGIQKAKETQIFTFFRRLCDSNKKLDSKKHPLQST